MAIVSIIPATIEHAKKMAPLTRDADREELWAASYQRPLDAMQMGLDFSDDAFVGCIDGEPIVMWGVALESLVGKIGIPWMIATKQLDDVAIIFLRRCRGPVLEMLSNYGKLINYVDARNKRAVRWLKFLGFEIEDPKPYGVLGMPFHRFTMTREV